MRKRCWQNWLCSSIPGVLVSYLSICRPVFQALHHCSSVAVVLLKTTIIHPLIRLSHVVIPIPASVDDSVFMRDEKERQEFVMNECGIIYKGSGNYITSINWDFGQVQTHTHTLCRLSGFVILGLINRHRKVPH